MEWNIDYAIDPTVQGKVVFLFQITSDLKP